MRRRAALGLFVSAFLGVAAGCSSTTEPSDSTPTQTTISTPTQTPTATSTPTATPTPTPSTELEEDSLVEYRAGDEDYENADRSGETASRMYGEEQYQEAEEEFRNTVEDAQAAIDHFTQAADLASESNHAEAYNLADEAATYVTQYWVSWGEEGIAAARAAQDGRFDDAEEHASEAASISEASEDAAIEIAAIDEYRDALDL